MFVERLMLLFVGSGLGIIAYALNPGWAIGVTAVVAVPTVWIRIVRYNRQRKMPVPKR